MTSQGAYADQGGEQRYRHLFKHAPICIFVIDLSANPATILEVNRRAELVFGYPAIELVGMPASHLMAEAAMPAMLTIVRQVQAGQTITAEITSRRRDGVRFPAHMIATSDPADVGRMIVTVEDITAKKLQRSEAEAIDAERRRIAHEIHDGVTQNLAGIRFKSALWHHLAETAPPAMQAGLAEIEDVLIKAIADLRRTVVALRPLDLETMGFLPALRQLVDDAGDQRELVSRLEVTGSTDSLPAVYELPLYRIIQEGLNNVGQHARASSVLVRLNVDPAGSVTVSVCDNGRGFDPRQIDPADFAGHFGLRQMRERILALGGTLDVRSAPGQGTDLAITLPPV